jgi:hypothetical protein
MADIWVGLAIMTLLDVALAALALKLRVGRRALLALAAGTVVAIILFVIFLFDNLRLALLLPFSNLVVVGNWMPPLACFLAGLAWRLTPRPAWRRRLIVIALVGICFWKSYGWFLEAPPETEDNWDEGVCLQTSQYTCSAASAATILRYCGVRTSETEMARLCLTRRWGTSSWGLYRGMKLKACNTSCRVQVFTGPLDSLLNSPDLALLICGLPRGQLPPDPRYVTEWGWTPGVLHGVCYLRAEQYGAYLMADPEVGLDFWSREDLEVLWTGLGIRIHHDPAP